MNSTIETRAPHSDVESARLIREEVLLRPARRATVFCVLVLIGLLVAAESAPAATYSSSGPISVPGFANASPYPATIGVTGLTGAVTDVDVRLHGLSHGTIDDLGVVLQAPSGSSILLMNGVGSFAVAGLELTIDDEAAQRFDGSANPASGSYRPAAYYTGDPFPSPGPGTGYCNPAPAGGGSCTLASAFDGSSPIGEWKLFARDFLGTSSGQIAGGWSLELAADGPADLTAPETEIASGPGEVSTRPNAAFTFAATEPATFECRLDQGGFRPCSSPASFTGLAAGDHRFAVRATDAAGNVDETPAEAGFRVDLEPPRLELGKVAVKSKRRRASVSFSGTDDQTATARLAFACALDGAPERSCSSPLALKRLKPGAHRVRIGATDEAGHQSEPATASFKLKRKRRRG